MRPAHITGLHHRIATAQALWRAYRQEKDDARENHRAADYLQTPEDIVAYLNAAIEEMGDDPRLLMKAFRSVAEALGGVSEIARRADMDRVALSRVLAGQRIPRLDTLTKVSAACGVRMRFSA